MYALSGLLLWMKPRARTFGACWDRERWGTQSGVGCLALAEMLEDTCVRRDTHPAAITLGKGM